MLCGAAAQIRNVASVGGNVLQRTRYAYFYDDDDSRCNKREPDERCDAVDGPQPYDRRASSSCAATWTLGGLCVIVNAGDRRLARMLDDRSYQCVSGPTCWPMATFALVRQHVPAERWSLVAGLEALRRTYVGIIPIAQASSRDERAQARFGLRRGAFSSQEKSMSMNVPKMRRVQFAELFEFVVVAEYRSFTRAAARLGVSTSTLSQTIRTTEDRLGMRLLNRTTRHVAPTPAGERLLERLHPVLEDLESALEELNEYRDRPIGCLHLAVAPAARHVLGPVLARFAANYPDIKIEISAVDGQVDVIAGHFDAGIQLSGHVSDNMVAIRVSGEIPRIVVGAPSYFAQHPAPRTPDELKEHNCIRLKTSSGRIDAWQFVREGEEFSAPVDGTIILNDAELALHMALSGGGLLYLPESCAKTALTAGTLQGVLQAWMPKPSDGFVLCYPTRRQNPAALRCLADFIRENLRGQPRDVVPFEPQLLCA